MIVSDLAPQSAPKRFGCWIASCDVGADMRIILACLRGAGVILAVLLAAGFFFFARYVTDMPVSETGQADGIVALTGGQDRIAEAVRLLTAGKGRRLLISGVNPGTNKAELLSLNADAGTGQMLFHCCVDLGKSALNTEDNAFETTEWVRRENFHSIILVTSNYHMPRSLIELRQAMPDIELIPYPVKSPRLQAEWWRDSHSSWVLAKEYAKFVAALARYAIKAAIHGVEKHPIAPPTIDARDGTAARRNL
jgi:uncharacterized SAM-binding protein YcdF (DUF218 family)